MSVWFWLLACGAEEVPDAAPSASTPAELPAVTEQPTAPEPSAAAELPTTGEPYVLTEEPRMPGMRDRFTFWGWSADSTRYAYETYMPGEGGVGCDMVHDVWVVDARTDDFAPEGHLQVAYDWPEGGPEGCTPASLPTRVAVERPAFLARHDIAVGRVVPPDAFAAGDDDTWSAGIYGFTFRVLYGTDDAYGDAAQAGAAYVLSLADRVLEPGERRRSYVLDYRPALLFRSPDGLYAAAMVQREHSAYEGTRWGWMSNGFAFGASPGSIAP